MPRSIPHAFVLAAVLSGTVGTGACRGDEPVTDEPSAELDSPELDERHAPPPDVVAPHDLEVPGLRASASEAAPQLDYEYTSSAPIEIRRYIYRFTLRLRGSIGGGVNSVPEPVSELRVDISKDRLRARLMGTGWPVPSGAEIRMRRDRPGVYLFDARGGRPLGPGMLAQWFQGGPVTREAEVNVRQDADVVGATDQAISTMFCRLLAEWANGSPDAYARRCTTGMPTKLYFGPFLVDRTAEVTLRVPRSTMRADHVDPPRPIAVQTGHAFFEPEVLARLEPYHRPPEPSRHSHPVDAGVPVERGLVIENRGPTRVVISIDGCAVGVVDAGATLTLEGLRPGPFAVGGGKPLGGLGAPKRVVVLPARVFFPR